MKKVLMLILWLGLGWSLLTLLNLSGQRTALQQEARTAQRKYDALKTLYDDLKEEGRQDADAWQETLREMTEEQEGRERENAALRQENEALRREAAAFDRAQADREREIQALTAARDQADRQLRDVLALLLPPAEETLAEGEGAETEDTEPLSPLDPETPPEE